jgi:hypothetical protein
MFVSPIRVLRTSGKVQVGKDFSHLTLIYGESKSAPELVLDYGRCEGGFPVFDITSVSAPDDQSEVTFKVTYSETIEGIDHEHGKLRLLWIPLMCISLIANANLA